jgi:predicted alpha/beta hydrolase
MINASQHISILTADGVPLAASYYQAQQASVPVCIVAPAMAVHRRFYEKFCRYLCDSGFHVVIFDYRGFGDTQLPKHLAASSSFRAIGELDLEAVIEFSLQKSDTLYFIGHSLGMQALGFSPSNHKIARVISVASGSGYYGWIPLPKRIARYFLWRYFMPWTARIVGHFPGKRLRFLGDIPGRMAIEWSKLCCTPGYLRATTSSPPEPAFAKLTAKMLVMSFTDDRVMPRAPIDDLHENFANADQHRVHLMPSVLGIKKIGHLDAFRESSKPLWQRWLRWLNTQSDDYATDMD